MTDAHTEPFITKQLVFTGVTRAQKTIAIFSTADIVCSALNLSADRATGLKERLDQDNEPK
jgi:ATP-dependent exoDNAse (exonuclease V) alpha subunit